MSPVLIHLPDLIISTLFSSYWTAFKMVLRQVQHGTLCWVVVDEIYSAYFEIKFKKSVLVFALGLCDTWTFVPKALSHMYMS
jgi:hypothetical protein